MLPLMVMRESRDNVKDHKDFRDFIGEVELIDPPLQGRKYTWSNKREVASMAMLDKSCFLFSGKINFFTQFNKD